MRTSLQKVSFLSALFLSTLGLNAQTQQIFSTAGTSTFTAPVGVLAVNVQCIGAGGAGGRVTPSNVFDNDAAGGGGGGAYAASVVPVFAGSTYSVTIGAGGINNGTSTNGGDSYFDNGTLVRAAGGTTRSGNDQVNGVDGGQAAASIGTTKFSGGKGGNGNESDSDGGGGGGAAGSTGAGANGGTITAGAATPSWGGNGGLGGANGANGAAGGTYGGGGGGSSANGSNDRNGGPGASGVVVISWPLVNSVSPTTICAGNNQIVEIKGNNFGTVNNVSIGGSNIIFTQMSDSVIHVNAMDITVGGFVIVEGSTGSAEFSGALNFAGGSVNVAVNSMTLTAVYSGNPNVSYQWLDCLNGNSVIPNATSSTYTSSVNGLFAVVVNDNGCEYTSSCFALASASVEEYNANNVKVFPNPTNDVLNFSTTSKIEKVEVMNIAGVVLNTYSNSVQSISLGHLSKGIYFVRISTNKGSEIKKVLIH